MNQTMAGETGGTRELELTEALAVLQARLTAATEAAGRNSGEIELLPVTKFFPATDVAILHHLGCEAFGESRQQEAADKAAEVANTVGGAPIRWHMVGRIQRNKAQSIAGWAYAAHSVDSVRVVNALNRASVRALADGERAEALRVYVQISLDGDTERAGVDVDDPASVDALCAAAQAGDGLEFVGLMAIPPLGSDADEAFARVQSELARVQRNYSHRLGLSAGMSGDLEVAVQHGSTCVRVGTALLGQRPLTSPGVVTPVTSSSQTPERS